MHKTKIIGTIGPSSDKPEIFRELVLNGLRIARLNLSHGDQPYLKQRIDMIKQVREELNIPIAILMDTRGPEIRIKDFVNDCAALKEGNEITIVNDDSIGTEKSFSITYKSLYKDISIGNIILLDDGLVELEVLEVKNQSIKCLIKNSGSIKSKKGINIPGVSINLPALTEHDKNDILFGIKHDVDFVAASFIRKASDVHEIRELLNSCGGENIQIISKIESQEGVDNIDEIIQVSDAIMIARGDLGVEIPNELIPLTQKMIIEKCNNTDVPVITATQMLDSMISNPRPTRAEVSDVANAVLDGTDAIMLSGETAAGAFPVEAVKVMRKVADASEHSLNYEEMLDKIGKVQGNSIENAVSYSTCSTAMNLKVAAIICPTHSGQTARLISMFRPNATLIAATTNPKIQRQMQLNWGVIPILIKEETSSDVLFYKTIQAAKSMGYIKSKDLIIITAGLPLGIAGSTNLMKIEIVE